MNGTQRKLALGLAAGFLLVITFIMIANAESSIADLRASGAHIRPDLVWSWEWTSMIAWLSVYPLLWVAVATIRPPRFSWLVVGAALLIGSLFASGWHIGVMVVGGSITMRSGRGRTISSTRSTTGCSMNSARTSRPISSSSSSPRSGNG